MNDFSDVVPKDRRRRKRPDTTPTHLSEADLVSWKRRQALVLPVSACGLSVRIVNKLESLGAFTLSDVLVISQDAINDTVGEKTSVEIWDKLKTYLLTPAWQPPGLKKRDRPHVRKRK